MSDKQVENICQTVIAVAAIGAAAYTGDLYWLLILFILFVL